jgi:hypothetical protein
LIHYWSAFALIETSISDQAFLKRCLGCCLEKLEVMERLGYINSFL